MRKPPNTTIRHNQLWARLYIPEDVRPDFDGQTLFLAKLGPWPMSLPIATALAAVQVAEWKQKIDHARNRPSGLDAISEADDGLADDTLALMGEEELRAVARGLLARIKALPASTRGADSVSGDGNTDFLLHFDEWKKRTHLKGKTLDQAVSDIKQFADAVPETLESLSGRHVQEWIEKLLESVATNTVRRIARQSG